MFGMVLAIGILVDDAIVVVENVERIMGGGGAGAEGGYRAKAMVQITGAIVGITSVLVAVFVPLAFFPGSVGVIYASSPSACNLHRPSRPSGPVPDAGPVRDPAQARRGRAWPRQGRVLRLVQPTLPGPATLAYRSGVAGLLRRPVRALHVYGLLVAAPARLGLLAHAVELPADRGPGLRHRRRSDPAGVGHWAHARLVKRIEEHFAREPASTARTLLLGFGFSGQGQNAALNFVG